MQRPALVASDVDGTLLNPLGRVSPRTADLVGRVLASGTPFVLATGRPPRWVLDVADATGASGYAVCSNGAVIYDIGADQVKKQWALDPVTLRDLARLLDQALPGCAMAAERVGESARSSGVADFVAEDAYVHPWEEGAQPSPGAGRADVLGHPAVKLLVRHSRMTSEEMAAAAGQLLRDRVAMTYSTNEGLLEFSAAGVTKASGLAEVARGLGVRPEEVIVFGDMPNDVPVLRWAGHGVAMANAHPDALAAADEVTGSNAEDGVAQVLERWF
ncbi:HAD family hydrolase [Saccharothrix coeruleofusca]|uniref:Haloacid dehalogenase n=1 Tax=Saccharothrix coeruleofusca TaxID=33919 RepID=A0A918AHB5_9PSEU|nr:HAD family hydrolase [Saccharothrix coeruleofusca]MBP2340117.1 Cof subfamily protein (haloacid dehalogenase superfamily) [Saccharothrix coeruleofusca]GGP37197.1 haloacid dehalogenase [Saccharothrix coeruleofusca]